MKYNIILKIYWRSEIILADDDMFFSEFIILAADGIFYKNIILIIIFITFNHLRSHTSTFEVQSYSFITSIQRTLLISEMDANSVQ